MKDYTVYKASDSVPERDVLAEEEVKFWVPQATGLAERGKSELIITQFLRSKGIEESTAILAAGLIKKNGKKTAFKLRLPFLIVGWFFIVAGTIAPLMVFFFYDRFAILSTLPAAFGCALVWGGLLQGDDGE